MHRRGLIAALFLILVVVGAVAVYQNGPSSIEKKDVLPESPQEEVRYNGTIYAVTPNVTVEIPPSLELYGIVYYLAMGNDTFVTDRGAYLNDVERWFATLKDHEAVKVLRKTIKEQAEYRGARAKGHINIIMEFVLRRYPEPEELSTSEILNMSEIKRLPPADLEFLKEFLPAFKDFAEKSNFTEFYKEHLNYYWEDLSIYVNALKKLPPDEFMKKYAGVSGVKYWFVHPYLVIVHGHSLTEERNGTTIWGAGGDLPLIRRYPQRTLWSYKTAKDDFLELPLNRDYVDNPGLDELIYLGFVYHELGHDITMARLEEEFLELGRMEYFIDAIRKDMPYLTRYDGHFSSVYMFYEGFADAWQDFALSHIDKDYTDLAIWMQKGWGEFWIGEQYELTRKYAEIARKEGKPFSEYVPQILEELESLASRGNVSAVYETNVPVTPLRAFDRATVTGKILVVYGTSGTNESERKAVKSAAEKIAANLKEFYDEGLTGTDVILKADVNVTSKDLKENLVLVGTPSVNSLVAEMQKEFPLLFVQDGEGRWMLERNPKWNVTSFVLTTNRDDPVVTGSLSNTSEAALLLAVRNPSNPANYIVWVAGTDENMTALFQNPTYYLSSYEIWSKNGIEIGFYIQPLRSSGG